jgi:hypothetical protein
VGEPAKGSDHVVKQKVRGRPRRGHTSSFITTLLKEVTKISLEIYQFLPQ